MAAFWGASDYQPHDAFTLHATLIRHASANKHKRIVHRPLCTPAGWLLADHGRLVSTLPYISECVCVWLIVSVCLLVVSLQYYHRWPTPPPSQSLLESVCVGESGVCIRASLSHLTYQPLCTCHQEPIETRRTFECTLIGHGNCVSRKHTCLMQAHSY